MPYYKKEIFVRDSVKSILNQSYKNFEIILVNDDVENKDFIKTISNLDNRIKLLHNEKNLGAGESRNRAIRYTKGDYIAFCDCDDLWKENKLKFQLNYMKQFDLNFSYTSYDIVDEDNNVINMRNAPSNINFTKLRNSCDIGLSTVIIKKNILEKNQYRFASLKTKEDYVFWLRIIKKSIYIRGLNKNLTYYRKTKNSLSSNIFMNLYNGYNVYRKFMKYNFITSCFCLFRLSINYLRKIK